ncbi:hypothetical protein BCR36DRAFT_409949 [Piromyces finnis]|uniref:Uncharacterized protein n=1 Tax=Piromyces finnis TaxID=1754191 RepID=A0A1Y1VHV2_9FUNG|nr:hypothetical protein BCR36DRAFT_409949 [Piromyces finnis]|eukprot:ORX55903.1 hypothetical protein BCR36DRAFT_409949 [Piromyces finnis]
MKMEKEQWNSSTLEKETTYNLKTELINNDFLEGKDLLLTSYIKGNIFLNKKPLVNIYECSSKFKINDNQIATYNFENLSDGTYVSDDQLSAITLLSSTNDDTEAESKHDIFPIDEYTTTNFDSLNSESEYIPHQLFDINNQNLNDDLKDSLCNNAINHDIVNNSSILNEKSFILNLNKTNCMNYSGDDLLDVNLFYSKEKDSDERNSTKSNYGISDDTYINSDSNENKISSDISQDIYASLMSYDEEHYQNLKEIDSTFGKHIENDNTILSSLYNSDVSDICSEESDLDIVIDNSICEEEEDSEEDDVEIIIAAELPTPPPSFYKKMAEIRKNKKAMSNENENNGNNCSNYNNSNNNSSTFSSSKRHKKHKYNRNNTSKYNKSSSKSSHCEPSTISIDDYIDHSSNSIFSSSTNKKKKNNKHFNKSKNASSVNNSNSISTGNEKTKSINHSSSKDENNELSTSWPSLASLYLSNNSKSNINKKTKETPSPSPSSSSSSSSSSNTHHNLSPTTSTEDNPTSCDKDQPKISNTSTYQEKFSYISLLSHIKENPNKTLSSSSSSSSPSPSESSENSSSNADCIINDESSLLHEDKPNHLGHSVPEKKEKKYVDYVITSKNTTTCITSVTSSLFLINCPESVKDLNSSYKSLNFFVEDSDSDVNDNEDREEEDVLDSIKKDDVLMASPKKSYLTESLIQSSVTPSTPQQRSPTSTSISGNSSVDDIDYSVSISPSNIPSILQMSSSVSSLIHSHKTTTSSISLSNVDNIPYQLSTSPSSQIIPSSSLSSNFTVSDCDDLHTHSSLIMDVHGIELDDDCSALPSSEVKVGSESREKTSVSQKLNSSTSIDTKHSHHSNDIVEISYSLDSGKDSSTLEHNTKTKTNVEKEICGCRCNTKNHFCSFVDHQFKLNREKRRLIKSALNCGFTDIHLKEDPNPCEEEDENSSDTQSHSSNTKYRNRDEESEKEDVINTILLSHTDFSTFPSHIKFTINSHDVWLKWTNLEINRNRFKNGRLL